MEPKNTNIGRLQSFEKRDRKKGTSPICRNGPKGASHKWGMSPFFLYQINRVNTTPANTSRYQPKLTSV